MKTIFTCLFISVALFVSAQQDVFQTSVAAPSIVYNNNIITMNQVAELSNGDYIAVGNNYETFSARRQGLLLKTDPKGGVLASKNFLKLSSFEAVVNTPDGGFAVAVNAYPYVKIIKFAADLTVQWQKDYAVAADGIGVSAMLQTEDGGFMLGGYKTAGNQTNALIIKTDSAGSVLFAKRYFIYGNKSFKAIAPATDGNYVLLANSLSAAGTKHDSAFVMKIKPDGSLLWSRAVFSNVPAETLTGHKMMPSTDGSIVITANLLSGSTYNQAVMIKYDNAGNRLWLKSMVLPNGDVSYGGGVAEDKDGGYIFSSSINNYDDNENVAYGYLVKTNTAGELQWTKKYKSTAGTGTATELWFGDMITTADGGFAACGKGYDVLPFNNFYTGLGSIFKFNSTIESCNTLPATSEGSNKDFGTDAAVANDTEDGGVVTATDTRDTFVEYYPAYTLCHSGVLPVQLLSFTASLQNKSVSINWKTANEVNTDYFVVERSVDRTLFTALQKVAARGNSSVTQAYGTTDLQPLQGTSYYRLKEVDKDGKVTYSSIVPVTVMSNGTSVISPNPVQNNIRVIVQSSTANNLTLQVVDMRGNVLAAQTKAVGAGRNEINIPAASLAKGVYILKVMDKASVQAIRFVKE